MLLVTLTATTVIAGPVFAAESPPAPGTPKDFHLPDYTTRELANGMKVTSVPFGEIPKVTISAVLRVGGLDEGKNTWLGELTGELLKEGAGERTGAQIAEQAAHMGGSVGVNVGADETSVSLDVLSENGPAAVALIADLLRRPQLPASELDRIKRDFDRQLALARTQPGSLATEAFLAMLYPDHPYGRVYPTREQLQAYTIDDVRKFYSDSFGAARTHLFISGRFDAAAMTRAVDTAFGDWARGPAPLVNVPQAVATPQMKLIDRPDAPQSTIYLGLPVIDPSQPDYLRVSLMNTLLGGSFSSRIIANIRENKGYAYSPNSSINPRYRSGYWVEQADVTTEHTGDALKEIYFEIERLRKEAPTEKELKGIQNYRAGVFVLQNATRNALITQLAFIDLHGLPPDYLTRLVERIYAFTPAQVSDAANTYIRPEQMTLVVVGDLKKIRSQLAKLPQLKGVALK
jgi:predicted Zn-dependent peptidase